MPLGARSRYRVTNGHRAAVCGLQIAGISLTDACMIVGVPYQAMRDLLGDWHEKRHPCRKWKGHLVDEVGEAWADRAQKVETIAARYNTTPGYLAFLARREGWPKRKHGPVRQKDSFLSMTPEEKRRFWKLYRALGSHSQARSIVAQEFR